ncbi:alpha/beta fold hydrolase [Gemmatimonadota bacterium]
MKKTTMPAKTLIAFLLFLLSIPCLEAQMSVEDLSTRQRYLDELLGFLPTVRTDRGMVTRFDRTWRDWQERTGELPPDFASMPSIPFLPDPLILNEGGGAVPIETPSRWRQKRRWIKEQVEHWLTGKSPPAPDNMKVELVSEENSGTITSRIVELSFGPVHQAKLTIELLVPPGDGPFPVFMTQWDHRTWALLAVRRGYLGCVYAGADSRDDTEQYADVWYPRYDFTRLMRRAWGGHRAVDYLYTLPFVDKNRIALTGHSRNGKQSLMAAAFDERITAVIACSGGTGAEVPWRYTDDRFANETILEITGNTPNWFHPRLRFFVGREHKLPVDQNLLMALIAPRALMLSSALTEYGGNPWGIEQNYHSLLKVYKLLDAEDNLAIWLRNGMHGTAARDIEVYLDFFDNVFDRKKFTHPLTLYYNYSFDRWRELSGERVDPLVYPEKNQNDLILAEDGRKIESSGAWEQKKSSIIERVNWMLGDAPPAGMNPGPRRFDSRYQDDWPSHLFGRPGKSERVGVKIVHPYAGAFGDYLYGDLYCPLDGQGELLEGKLPVVVFLHGLTYHTGFSKLSSEFVENLVGLDCAVFAFDMIGCGSRILEGTRFYERYSHWSKLGKMVADVSSAIDMLERLDFIDRERIYIAGYSLGATVGLLSTALDERIAGIASVSGFTPLRPATQDKGIEGVWALSHQHGLLPRLGFFTNHLSRIPVDFDEILACIAPRPLLCVAPTLDKAAHHPHVTGCAEKVQDIYRLYGEETSFEFSEPLDYNRFPEKRQEEIIRWLAECLGR